MAKVFISHKNTDERLAERVARRVRANGLETYLDTIDDALIKDGPDLADHLLKRMAECEQLIAVISPATAASWWVPWEIGVGSEKGFRMASYSEAIVGLPSYLQKWPVLRNDRHIDLYCQMSKQTETTLKREFATTLNEARRLQMRQTRAESFHKSLKNAL